MFIFAWRIYPEPQWETGTVDLVALLFPLFLLLILQPYHVASASASLEASATLKENIAWEVVLTATFTARNPDRVTSRSVSASLTVKGWPHFFRHPLAKPQSDLTQQFHAKAWSGMWGGATRHFLTCSPFYVCQLICVSLMMFL